LHSDPNYFSTPENIKSQFTIIDASHLEVPRSSDEVLVEWLRKQWSNKAITDRSKNRCAFFGRL